MDLERTRALVRELHGGDLDQIGRPYYLHLDRVLHRVIQLFPEAPETTHHAALLHGSVEEKKTTLAALRHLGYADSVIDMVKWNTRPRGSGAPPYLHWIQELAHTGPLGAVMIKIADLDDNRDPARIAQLPPDRRDVADVYAEARSIGAFSRRSAILEAKTR